MIPLPPFERARHDPAAIALIDRDGPLTYGEWAERSLAAADALERWGLAADEPIALWAPNGRDWAIAVCAAWLVGAPVALISTRWVDQELTSALARTGIRHVLASGEFATRAAALGLETRAIASLTGDPSPRPLDVPGDRIAALLFTSGTTGAPKAVMLAWSQLHASAQAVSDAFSLAAGDRWWMAMPLFHVGGLGGMLRCAWRGATLVLAPRFEPAEALETFRRARVTLASVVPTMLQSLLVTLDGAPWPADLRALMLGGAPIPPSLAETCPLALASYGLTEATSTVTLVPPGADLADRLTSGVPLPGYALRILGNDGEVLPHGREGAIAVRSPAVFAGYRHDPEATARVMQDGWLLTGDLGRLDEAGRLTVLARRSDLIVSGGENIYPAEVEAALTAHPQLASCAVVGAPHPRWGEAPVAFVVPREATLGAEELADWLVSRLSRFKHPRHYAMVDALPLLANGKVDRLDLKARAQGAFLGLE